MRRLVLFLFLGAILEYSLIAVLVCGFWGFGGTGRGGAGHCSLQLINIPRALEAIV